MGTAICSNCNPFDLHIGAGARNAWARTKLRSRWTTLCCPAAIAAQQNEDDGNLTVANPTGLNGPGIAIASGTIGDAPANVTNGDYDWYRIDGVQASQFITVDIEAVTTARGSTLNSSVAIYDSAGFRLAQNDNDGSTNDSFLTFQPPFSSGTFFVVVHGNGSNFQANPLDSNSGYRSGNHGHLPGQNLGVGLWFPDRRNRSQPGVWKARRQRGQPAVVLRPNAKLPLLASGSEYCHFD